MARISRWPAQILDTFLGIVEFLAILSQVVLLSCWGMIRALIPKGKLSRKSVKGDICLVTGSGSGLGRIMAIEFGKLGCTLVLWDINQAGNEETKKMLKEQGIKAHSYTVDLSDRTSINTAAARIKAEVGNVDILINNAGIVTGKKVLECPDELMEKTMAVNTNAMFFTTKNFLPSMLKRNHGHFITIASLAGKGGAPGLTTLVCPFFINTGMFDGVRSKCPRLSPILNPHGVVSRIIDAVLTDTEELQIPKSSYFSVFLSSILPSEAKHILADYLGMYELMETFKGREK